MKEIPMKRKQGQRRAFRGVVSGLLMGVAGLFVPWNASAKSYEIWVANQGLDKIQIIDGTTLKVTDEIEMDGDGVPATSKPHMVLFSPGYRYAYVANVGAAKDTNNITVIRTSDRKVVAVLPSGPVTHAVVPSPDGKGAVAVNVGSGTLREIKVDEEKETFTPGREISFGDGPGGVKERPICAAYSADSRKVYVTIGGDPAALDPLSTGAIVVIDMETGKPIKRFSNVGQEACGLDLSKDGKKMYVNVGGFVNVFAVIDTKTDTVQRQGNAAGYDTHGLRLTPDGGEFWLVNRMSDSLTIVDTRSERHAARITEAGNRPDLIDFSPDGKTAFVTLRGHAVTKTIHDVTGREPGLMILDVQTRKRTGRVALEGDPHGLAVRPGSP